MKKLILIFIMIGIYSVCQAKSWQSYPPLGTYPVDGDYVLINDISDTEDHPDAGTVKQLAWLYVQPRDSDLTAVAALTTAAYGLALLEVATELAFQQLVNLEVGVDVQAYNENLEAIADAETGVSDPMIMMYDSDDAAGTAMIKGTSVGGDTLNDIIMSFWVDVAGIETEYLQLDGVTETVDVLKPLSAPSIDAGTKYVIGGASPVTIDADVCKQYFTSGSTRTYNLPAESKCQASSDTTAKEFCFSAIGAYVLTINPDDADYMYDTAGVKMSAGEALVSNGSGGEVICYFGTDVGGEDRWYIKSYAKTWAQGG